MTTRSPLYLLLRRHESLQRHPHWKTLLEIATGESSLSSAGFPFICETSFNLFIERVPHLFRDGHEILLWLRDLERVLATLGPMDAEAGANLERSVKVIQNMTFTAGVTAPPDLWLMRHVLSVHRRMGITERLLEERPLNPALFAERRGLNAKQLSIDLHFLHARGLVAQTEWGFTAAEDPAVRDIFQSLPALAEGQPTNLVPALKDWFDSEAVDREKKSMFGRWFQFEAAYYQPETAWLPNRYHIELGYRLLPLVLSLRSLNLTKTLKEGTQLLGALPRLLPEMSGVLEKAGLAEDGMVTRLGARVFSRGPGPFGIIGAYHPYLNALEDHLRRNDAVFWVSRGENVAASQDANRKTFKAANDALDAFCASHRDFQCTVFIEHAVGKGEATRQRFERSGDGSIQYFGADLEDDAIDQAIESQKQGFLPKSMRFIRSADIGRPEKVLDYFARHGIPALGAVMMVGNGFHEIRDQTNEKMLAVFSAYQEAGILLIFTEESALSDRDLLNTAWNTYHAGFRYVHDMSGQGLRPATDQPEAGKVWGWRRCAKNAGYRVMDEYTHHTRTIYPFKKPARKNPSISVTYFCVPKAIAEKLGIE